MATASVTQLAKIEHEDIDIGLAGMLRILMRRTYRADPSYNELGALTDAELVTIANQARNVHTAALEGLTTVGTLVSCFNPQCDVLDHNAVGWLTGHLSETVREMGDIEWSATYELARRGYDSMGSPLPQRAQA
jgi:hypothetical protein